MRVVVGVGCDRGVALATLEAAVEAALSSAGLGREAVVAVATIDIKRDEVALCHLARQNGWPLHCYPAETLAAIPVPHPSEIVRRYTGTPAVAEAAALHRAQGTVVDLIVEKQRLRGEDGRNATISIVRMKP